MTRALYMSLLRLHPSAFRRQFAPEMLWIFDEARISEGALLLLVDVVVSLVRQWFLRAGVWKVATAMLGALLQVAPALWMGSRPRRWSIQSSSQVPIQTEVFVAITMCMIAFIVFMVVAAVFWSTSVSRRKEMSRCNKRTLAPRSI
jgi:hypothetical protein